MTGNPAPLPKSANEPDLKSINLTNWAESRICLSHKSNSVFLDMKLCFWFALIKLSENNLSLATETSLNLRSSDLIFFSD